VRPQGAGEKLPVTRKSDLIALQKEAPPFAGMMLYRNYLPELLE